jgi:hypothetical protein
MSDPRTNLDEQIRRSLADLETMRDEIRASKEKRL